MNSHQPRPTNSFIPFKSTEIEQPICARFEAQAARRPSALATSDGTRRWSYGELNAFANRIARAVLDEALPADRPVVLLFEHGAMALAAMLGVLKAGRFYVPLNPSLPVSRLATLMGDSRADLILTNQFDENAVREFADSSVTLLQVDRLGANLSEDNPELVIRPDAPASIIYTSGSTGAPKGVLQTQRNLLHMVMKYTNAAHLDESDRLLLIQHYDMTAAAAEIFGALLNGASLHLFDLRAHGFNRLAEWIVRERVTIYYSTPQVFRRYAEALAGGAGPPSLRLLRLSGEPLLRSDVELYRRHFSEAVLLLNNFGATEMNMIRHFFLDHSTSFDGPVVPVGYELPDTEIVMLDENGDETVGTGEIAIRSPFLFPGYWQNPEITAPVLAELPDGRRIFRTGDRGLMLPDGCLVHLGRSDSRMKIRGHSVEAAEVEAALMAEPAVRQAVVVGRPDHAGETRLVAYVASEAAPSELRRRLKRKLPASMVPATFVRLKTLPVTPAGKIDRRALPDPNCVRDNIPLPRNPVELLVARIWEEVLGVWPVDVGDDFFELGGDSLLALQLVTRLEAIATRSVLSSLLLDAPTVERQAAILLDSDWSPSWPTAVVLQPHGDQPGFFFVPGAGAGVLSLVTLARSLGDKQPFYGLQPPGLDGAGRLLRTIEELATHFVDAVRRVQPRGPYFLGGVSFGGMVALEMAQQMMRAGETVGSLTLLDTFGPCYPRMRRAVSPRFHLFRLLGERFPQAPDRSWRSIAAELRELWTERLRILSRRLTGRTVPWQSRHFQWRDTAMAASHRYRSRNYSGPVTLFRLKGRPSSALYHPDPMLGWGAILTRPPEVVDLDLVLPFPGAHAAMLREPWVGEVAAKLRGHLDTARTDCASNAATGR
jgi:amino acid adenylation domain-containing protein